ncbi:MAG TPA: 50S ribosomal protein L31e, partial [Nitrosopumilaceae archaeon]|nr:50S ribosomal protein L31e [Nitrosopumilaceae archaeon]
MSQELERVYTINLGKVLLSPDNQRSKRAINMIKEFARHHMKTKDVKIDEDLAHQVWKRGIKHPPRKIRVRMTKTEEGSVLIAPYEEEIETKVSPEEKSSKLEEKVEKVTPEKPKEVAAEIVEAAEKEIIEKPKKAQAKEKPKSQAKEEKPKPQAKQKPTTPAKEETPKKAPAKEETPKKASA